MSFEKKYHAFFRNNYTLKICLIATRASDYQPVKNGTPETPRWGKILPKFLIFSDYEPKKRVKSI